MELMSALEQHKVEKAGIQCCYTSNLYARFTLIPPTNIAHDSSWLLHGWANPNPASFQEPDGVI